MLIFSNIKLLFSKKKYLLAYIIMVAVLLTTWYTFTNHKIMFGNYGPLHTWTDIILSLIVILGFPLFVLAWIFRGITLGKGNKKQAGAGFLGGIIGVIISGSSCCGLTLAMYVGLVPLMSLLPWNGLELKILAVLMMLYALHAVLSNLTTCMYTPKTKK